MINEVVYILNLVVKVKILVPVRTFLTPAKQWFSYIVSKEIASHTCRSVLFMIFTFSHEINLFQLGVIFPSIRVNLRGIISNTEINTSVNFL